MRHPTQLTFVPGTLVPAGGRFALWGLDLDDADLDAAATGLDLPGGEPGTLATLILDREGRLRPRDVPARLIPVLPAVRRLAAMPPGQDWPAWRRPSSAVLAWSVGAKLSLELVAAGRLLPAFRTTDTPGSGRAHWRIAAPDEPRIRRLAQLLPVAAHGLRDDDGEPWAAEDLLLAFADAVADACAREGRRPELDSRRRGPRRPFPEMWADALAGSDPTVAHLRVAADDLAAEMEAWAAPLDGRDRRTPARLALRLQAPTVADGHAQLVGHAGEEHGWWLTYLLQASDADQGPPGAPAEIEAVDVWNRGGGPVELAGHPVSTPEELLVRGLARAARLYAPLDRSLSESRPVGLELDAEEVAHLLSEGVEALDAAGIVVRVPPELRDSSAKRLRLRVRVGQSTASAPRVDGEGPLSLSSITDLRYEIALGDEPLSQAEFAEIVASKEPLVRWRGTWVRVDHEEVDRIAQLAGDRASLELTEALAAALSGQHHVTDLGWVETVADGSIGELIERLRDADAPGEAEITGIEGELRPYQRRGVAWLQRLTQLGMGGVLADQMGLGKTLMAIALLTSRAQDRPHLVVCPTSVVGNWERELDRFAPGLPVVRHHGPDRPASRRAFKPGQVTVTSYALLRRDIGMLEDIDWDVVVFDEAQQIKNPSSKGARAARDLSARSRIAMTGTPIENRLSELWAIVDVTNPGLLGTQRAFTERFAAPIERWHDEGAATRLRRLVAPFVLRRLKSDPEVSVDLPPKQEVEVTCSLTREQAALYQAAIDEAFSGQGLGRGAFERRGRILALLTALKQICNHPSQYLGDDRALVGRSGKLTRATEILGEVVDSGDRTLVFTQFREMGQRLATHLFEELGLPEVPFLHGGVPMAARDAMVDRFQQDADAPPVLLVSLRAGGTGLNLTRATHVMHYDRWWNPAVEDQATDRAHRIGQDRAVTVHTLVTAGTIEERISQLLLRKRVLAEQVVASGETWITELDDDELHDLVALSTDDLADDEEPQPVPSRPVLAPVPGGRA